MRFNLAKVVVLWLVFLTTIVPTFCQPTGDPLQIDGPDSMGVGDTETYKAYGGNGANSYQWSPDGANGADEIGSLSDPLNEDEVDFSSLSEGQYTLTLDDGGNGDASTGPVTKTIRVNDPANDHFLSSFDDASGPKYRKIGLNGVPLSDDKPQQSEESDEPPEETYIDALNLQLQHQTTDIYIPLVGGNLSLSVRRNAMPEVWDTRAAFNPAVLPTKPFGPGWSSNVCSYVEAIDGDEEHPATYNVVDENGSRHRFVLAGTIYVPIPNSWNDQSDITTKLEGSISAGFTFTKKFGNVMTFSGQGWLIQEPPVDPQGQVTNHVFCRATSIVDRFGTSIQYAYAGRSTQAGNYLIPSSISSMGMSILINAPGKRISTITDPKGNQISYNYGNGLTSVTHGTAETRYTYSYMLEMDPKPRHPDDPVIYFRHVELQSITDPNLHTFSFNWELDYSRTVWDSEFGDYHPGGNPRNISKVSLPIGEATFFNNSKLYIIVETTGTAPNEVKTPKLKGTRNTQSIDAAHQTHIYDFTDSIIFPLSALGGGSSAHHTGYMIFYENLKITTGDVNETYHFNINAGGAVDRVTDVSHNTTTFTYNDPLPTGFPSGYPAGFYEDPRSQTDALGHTKFFTYDLDKRIMLSVVDEANRPTNYILGDQGQRTKETIGSSQITDFTYDPILKGFMTSKTVVKQSGDPSWAGDLVTSYLKDTNGRVESEIVDPSGLNLRTSYTYDANGNKATSTDPKLQTTSFFYDAHNRLTDVIYADATTKSIGYDPRGNKIRETDENNHSTLYKYDELNRLTDQGRDMNDDGQLTRPEDLVTSYTYNLVNSKLSETDPNGNTTTFVYDYLQRLTSTTTPPVVEAPAGYTTYYYYDGTNCGGSVFSSTPFNPTYIYDSRNYDTIINYDELYRETSKTTYFSPTDYATTSKEYDYVGNQTASVDPLGQRTETVYDALDRPTITKFAVLIPFLQNPNYGFTKNSYTSTGLKWKVRDENGKETETRYDGAGRPEYVLQPQVDDGTGTPRRPITQTIYDPAGNVAATINPRLKRWDFTYDGRNRKLTEQQPSVIDAMTGNPSRPLIITTYDNVGNVTDITDARENTTSTLYDVANRPYQITSPPVPVYGQTALVSPITSKVYDNNGNVLTVTDANTHVTTNTYDALNRLKTTRDAENILVQNEYDAAGNLTKVTDGKLQVTRFEYDGLNRNTGIIDSQNNTTTFEYNGVNKTKRIDALSQRTDYRYDLRNRLTGVRYYNSAGVEQNDAINSKRNYVYDLVGNLRSVTEPGKAGKANVSYTYDALNRQLTETSNGRTHQYKYDLAGNRVVTQYGGTNRTLYSLYDDLNRLIDLDDGNVTAYGYDLAGNIIYKNLPSSNITTTYDALNHQIQISSDKYNLGYFYDIKGNLKYISDQYYDTPSLNRSVLNTYDSIDRLVYEEIQGNSYTETGYGYDSANNRDWRSINGDDISYEYNELNQLVYFTTSTGYGMLDYDLNGSRIYSYKNTTTTSGYVTNTKHYTYDYENRLISVNDGGVTNVNGLVRGVVKNYNYSYDYRTRRISIGQTGKNIEVVFSGGNSVQEYLNDGTEQTLEVENIRGSDWGGGVGGILYSIRNNEISCTHYDARGDVIAKTNQEAEITYQATYEAFGTRTQETGSTLDRQKANTKDEDPWGGLNEGMRYRDLETGTFITRDPAGFVDGPNLYTYVQQNPWTKFDPEGLFWAYAVDAGFAAYDTYQYSTGKISGSEYGQRMAITAASVAVNTLTGGGFTGGGTAMAVAGRAGLRAAAKVAITTGERLGAQAAIQTASHIEDINSNVSNSTNQNGSVNNSAENGSPESSAKDDSNNSQGEVDSDFKGKADYSHIKDPKNVDASTKPTARQVREMKEANRNANGGTLKDDVTGENMVDSAKSQKGVKPPDNEVQVDHIIPIDKGGTRTQENLELRTRKNNRTKSNN